MEGEKPRRIPFASHMQKRDSVTAADRLGLTPNQGKDVSGSSGKGGEGAGLYVRIPAEKEVAYLGIHQKTENSPKSKKLSMFIVDIFVFLCFWEFLSGM